MNQYTCQYKFSMKVAIFFLISLCCSYGSPAPLPPPPPSGPVADYAGLFDNSTRLKLNSLARSLWVERKFGVIIATVPSTDTVPIETYTELLYCAWRVDSRKTGENALILFSVSPAAIQLKLSKNTIRYLDLPGLQQTITREVLPLWKKGKYEESSITFFTALSQMVVRQKRSPPQSIDLPEGSGSKLGGQHVIQKGTIAAILLILATGILIVMGMAMIVLVAGKKNGQRHFPAPFNGGIFQGSFGGWLR